jgi:Ca-activated chloride channel family protein
MFRFANNELLYLLVLVPGLIILYLFLVFRQRSSMREFTDPEFFDVLMPLRSPGRRTLKFVLFLLVVTSLILALARPQFGSRLEEVKREGIEMIIALDVSRSMLAEDIEPSRLERAKQAIASLVNRMQDDKIGMIVFAGDAYSQLPITTDYISAKIFLDNINTDIVSKQGTSIGSAIDLGARSFTQDAEASKVIVVISDGENHEGDALEATKRAAEKGIKVYTIGMGTVKGAAIPLSRRGGLQAGVLKDREGKVVISRMDPKMLSEIASVGGGKYYQASTSNVGLHQLYNDLNKLNKSEIETKVYSEYDDQFHYFVALAFLFLILDMLILERKSKYFRNISIFGKK